jgi:predicted nuclease of restriction endonuclease-like RecB superfamily
VLPSPLLVTVFSRGKIRPRYAVINESTLQLVQRLTEIFRNGIGKTKERIYGELERFENEGRYDYRMIRGLTVLLMRRCVFEASSPIDPKLARKLVFTLAGEAGVVTSWEKRAEIIRKVAEELKIATEELEKSLWSDFDENLILRQFNLVSKDALIKYYNLALTQTLLFKAVSVDFIVRGGSYKKIYRDIKRLGLMYFVETVGAESYRITVEGPMALIKMTEKYGTSIAKLLPTILESEYWRIRADILRRREGFPRVYGFELDCREVRDQLEELAESKIEANLFDSHVEEKFWKDFSAMEPGWTIKREPEPLILSGGTVMIPDFSFEKDGVKVYLEVVGFWTKEYLEKKIRKLRQLSLSNIIIAIDKKLGSQRRLSGLPGEIILFERTIPLKPIVEHLKTIEGDILSKQLMKIPGIHLKLEGDVTDLKEISTKTGVPVEALTRYIRDNPQPGYVAVGDQVVSEKLLREIEAKLETLQKKTLIEASKLIQEAGVSNPQSLLKLLGYVVKWHGIEPDKALISREASRE